jgi:membrane protein
MNRFKSVFDFLRQVFNEWNMDKVPRLAAALAFFTMLSIAPLLIVIIAVSGLLLGNDVARQQVIGQVQGLVGPQGGALINTVVQNTRQVGTTWFATIFGIVVIVLGATGVVGELKDALNTIWNVASKPGDSILHVVRDRVFSLGMVLGLGFMLLVSLVISAALTALGSFLVSLIQQWVFVAGLLDLVVSLGVITLIFAALFKFLPDVRVAWRDVWIGALVTALLFTLGKYIIGVYLGNSNLASPFGAAGSLVVLLVWVYYAAQILFLGAEITQVYANRYGAGIRPDAHAVALSDAERVAQGTRAPSPLPTGATTASRNQERAPSGAYTLESGVTSAPANQTSGAAATAYFAPPPTGPFNPVRLLSAALGVRFFALLKRLFARVHPAPYWTQTTQKGHS